MATFTMYNAAGSGFYMSPTDAAGWSYVEGDPNSQAILENSGTNAGVGNYWGKVHPCRKTNRLYVGGVLVQRL